METRGRKKKTDFDKLVRRSVGLPTWLWSICELWDCDRHPRSKKASAQRYVRELLLDHVAERTGAKKT